MTEPDVFSHKVEPSSSSSSTLKPRTPPDSSPTPQLRPKSRLVLPLLCFLVPASIGGLLTLPILIFLSLIPVLGFFSLPSLISLVLFLIYSLTWTLYLLLAQTDPPTNVSLPFLPIAPARCLKVSYYILRLSRDFISARAIDLFLDLQVRRVMLLGGKDARKILKENILYAEGKDGKEGKRLDVYYPIFQKPHPATKKTEGQDSSEEGASQSSSEPVPERQLGPVIVFFGGGNWTWWSKKWGSQCALRLRRLGYCVVVPDIVQWPDGKMPEMVTSVRKVLQWTEEKIQTYGGDPEQIYILGYGSGAHVSMLTLVQDAVVNSRDSHFQRLTQPLSTDSLSADIEVSTGIRRCQIWGEEVPLPPVLGLICVSGVFDVVKQLRSEAKIGIEDVSALRRACGPSSSATLLSCPSHLLYGAKEILEPERLPPKMLIIAGGKDTEIPYSQSVLIKTLLEGVGVPVRLKLYRDETHLGSLASLMHQTRYSSLILQEIESLVASAF
ncbi:alpha/beta-hydrolase [Meredithblackwellia eburnea MCA 4105]